MIIQYFGIDKLEVKHWIRLTGGYLTVFPFFYAPRGGEWTIFVTAAILLTLAANALVTIPLLIEGVRYIIKKEHLPVLLWRRVFLINFFFWFFVTIGRYI